MSTDLSDALEEQKAYYEARAREYDEWFLRTGRYDRGPEFREFWFGQVDEVRSALDGMAAYGDVLEFAGGTGLWTERLVPAADSVTVLDASPEMIAVNRARVDSPTVDYLEGDIFAFEPPRQYDLVFFGFWLSHVPSDRFEEFWKLVARCLKPGGRFFFVDSLKQPESTAVDHVLPDEDHSEFVLRKLNDGREFRIFKLFYKPEALSERLGLLGLDANVRSTESFFIYGSGGLRTES